MDTTRCVVCAEPAVVVDLEYEEGYCDAHARTYEVYGAAHVLLPGHPDHADQRRPGDAGYGY